MNIRKLRRDYRLSQSDLAGIFNCTQAHVSCIENGTRNLTKDQFDILIERYGLSVISKYAEPGELPGSVVTVEMGDTISGNTAPVQNGNGNNMSTDAALVALLKQQSDQLSKAQEQMDRLIAMLENKYPPSNEK